MISVEKLTNNFFSINFEDKKISILPEGCGKCFSCEPKYYIGYNLSDLDGKIFIEFGENHKLEDETFENFEDSDDNKNIQYNYYYIEYKDTISNEETKCFFFAIFTSYYDDSPMHYFNGKLEFYH